MKLCNDGWFADDQDFLVIQITLDLERKGVVTSNQSLVRGDFSSQISTSRTEAREKDSMKEQCQECN